jgi:hypothetical protein
MISVTPGSFNNGWTGPNPSRSSQISLTTLSLTLASSCKRFCFSFDSNIWRMAALTSARICVLAPVPPNRPSKTPFGFGNSNQRICTDACRFAACGDGFVNLEPLADGGLFQEVCDWGSGADGGACTGPDGGCNSDTLPDHCRENCLPARCGDGVTDTGERCDLGPPQPNDGGGNGTGSGCNATCSLLGVVTTLGGTGLQGHVDGPGAQSEFFFPRGVTVASGVAYQYAREVFGVQSN